MKFIQDRDGDWSAHEMPFRFVLFPQTDGTVATCWAYHDRTGEEIVSDLQAAIDWCHQFMLATTLDQLKRILQLPLGQLTTTHPPPGRDSKPAHRRRHESGYQG